MKVVGDIWKFNNSLAEIRKRNTERYAESKDLAPALSPDDQRLVDRFVAGEIPYHALSLNASVYCSIKSLEAQRTDPFPFSSLQGTLELETWAPNSALLILAGVDPQGAVFDWEYENYMGATIHEPQIRHAVCFSDRSDLYSYPVDSDYHPSRLELKELIREAKNNGSSQAEMDDLLDRLKEAERWREDETSIFKTRVLTLRSAMLGILKRRWDSCEHDEGRRESPNYFVRWAEKRGFEIEWAVWARENKLLSEAESAENPPFFDADSEDYPEYLHIAVAAWEHARTSTGGTPKQRVIAFVKERYPHISEGTRDAIALVVNWQKAGGRPRTGG
ncbi:MAG: hypothetical protein V4731_03195 [Pseudomonadota bacterium]